MKKISIVIILASLFACEDSKQVSYYDNGNIESEGYTLSGKKQGVWMFYDKNGDTAKVNNFHKGILDGIQKYYVNNKLSFTESLSMGELRGKKTTYHSNGQIEATGNIKNGKQEGEWNVYYENGQLQTKLFFKDGIKQGKLLNYHDNGQVAIKGEDVNGNGIIEYFDSQGNLVWKINFDNAVPLDTLEFNPEFLP